MSLFGNQQVTVVITGSYGLLAQALFRVLYAELPEAQFVLLSRKHPENPFIPPRVKLVNIDILQRKDVRKIFLEERPTYVLHTAAMTNVDACEQDKSTCWNVNVKAVEIITEACRLTDTHLIHYSSDYIFDGREGPYPEAASPNPINYYGKSKLAAENICIGAQIAHTILRTNVLYGFSQDRKQHFVEWVLHKLRQEQPFKVVDDQFSNPTLTDDIAIATLRIIQRNTKGIINVAGQTWHSRFDFAKIIAEVFGLEANFEPMKTADLGQAAARPLRGGLQSDRLQLLLGFRTADSLAGVHTYRQQLKMFGQWSPDFQ